jgi:hypothetical protein
MQTTLSQLSRKHSLAFAGIQLLVISSGMAWAAFRHGHIEHRPQLPALLDEPLRVLPLYDNREVVNDSQLAKVLDKLKPRLRGPRPNMNDIDHALRFWGVEAQFDDAECLSGVEMRDLLLDHRQFAHTWGDGTQPFLLVDGAGIRVRTQQGAETASHDDHTLASLAEAGVPLDFPVITENAELPLRAVLEQSLRDFSLNQIEYEWSALAYALYAPETKHWTSTEGQEITFDRLADRLMRQRLRQGVCRGNHRLHALVMLLRVDEQSPILSAECHSRIVAYLQDVTQRFVQTQQPDGYWDETWPGQERDGGQVAVESLSERQTNRLLVTGHVLEWWSLAPPEVQPPQETLRKAGQWLVAEIDKLRPAQVTAYYTYLTHAGRALALWRGRFPHEVDLP